MNMCTRIVLVVFTTFSISMFALSPAKLTAWVNEATTLLDDIAANNLQKAKLLYANMLLTDADINKMNENLSAIDALDNNLKDLNRQFTALKTKYTIPSMPTPSAIADFYTKIKEAFNPNKSDTIRLFQQMRAELVDNEVNARYAQIKTSPTASWKNKATGIINNILTKSKASTVVASIGAELNAKNKNALTELATIAYMVDKELAEKALEGYPASPSADDKARLGELQAAIATAEAGISTHDTLK